MCLLIYFDVLNINMQSPFLYSLTHSQNAFLWFAKHSNVKQKRFYLYSYVFLRISMCYTSANFFCIQKTEIKVGSPENAFSIL